MNMEPTPRPKGSYYLEIKVHEYEERNEAQKHTPADWSTNFGLWPDEEDDPEFQDIYWDHAVKVWNLHPDFIDDLVKDSQVSKEILWQVWSTFMGDAPYEAGYSKEDLETITFDVLYAICHVLTKVSWNKSAKPE